MGKEAVDWLLDFYRGTTPGLSLIQVTTTFAAAFLIAKIFYAVCEHVVFRRPLHWSSHMLSLLVAAVSWGPLFAIVSAHLEALAGYLNGKAYSDPPILYFVIGSFVLLSPFSVLIIPILLLYLVYPKSLESRKTRIVFVYVVTMAMLANYVDPHGLLHIEACRATAARGCDRAQSHREQLVAIFDEAAGVDQSVPFILPD